MNIRLTNGHVTETGCIVDSHHGQYMIDMIADYADGVLGTTCYAGDVGNLRRIINSPINALSKTDDWSAEEQLIEMWDVIENRLNSLLPDDSGHYFGNMPDTSDWGLYPVEDGE